MAIGVARRRRALRQDSGDPCGGETEHVREIVSGIGEQGGRVRQIAIERLDPDECSVERYANEKGATKIDGRMVVAVRVIVIMAVAGMVMIVAMMMAVRMAVAHSLTYHDPQHGRDFIASAILKHHDSARP